MKTFANTLPFAAMLLAGAKADGDAYDYATTTTTGSIVTSYYTICPSSTSSSTSTMTTAPDDLMRTGDDGRETIYRTETTILPHMCVETPLICGATYTLTSDCPCTAGPQTTWTEASCPSGFTTAVVACTACAANGGPATVTITTPISNGPYATVTPQYGPAVANPSDICNSNYGQNGNSNMSSTGSGSGAGSNNYGSGNGGSGSGSNSNGTMPYGPSSSYKPYAGAAGKLDISLEGSLMVMGAGLMGALAILL